MRSGFTRLEYNGLLGRTCWVEGIVKEVDLRRRADIWLSNQSITDLLIEPFCHVNSELTRRCNILINPELAPHSYMSRQSTGACTLLQHTSRITPTSTCQVKNLASTLRIRQQRHCYWNPLNRTIGWEGWSLMAMDLMLLLSILMSPSILSVLQRTREAIALQFGWTMLQRTWARGTEGQLPAWGQALLKGEGNVIRL